MILFQLKLQLSRSGLFVQNASSHATAFAFFVGFFLEFLEGIGVVLFFPGTLSQLAWPRNEHCTRVRMKDLVDLLPI